MRHLSPETVSELLYKLTKKELGTRTLITAAVKRVELDSHMAATLTAQNLLKKSGKSIRTQQKIKEAK